MQLGNVIEVLAIHANDKGGHQQKRSDDGKPLHHVVLVVGHLGLVVIADPGNEFAGGVEALRGTKQLVIGAAEM